MEASMHIRARDPLIVSVGHLPECGTYTVRIGQYQQNVVLFLEPAKAVEFGLELIAAGRELIQCEAVEEAEVRSTTQYIG